MGPSAFKCSMIVIQIVNFSNFLGCYKYFKFIFKDKQLVFTLKTLKLQLRPKSLQGAIKNLKKYRHISTHLDYISSPHDPILVAFKDQKLQIPLPKIICSHLEQGAISKKERGVAIVVYVRHGYRSKFPSTHGHTHTTMATPLQLSVEIDVCSRCELLIWAAFLFFYRG